MIHVRVMREKGEMAHILVSRQTFRFPSSWETRTIKKRTKAIPLKLPIVSSILQMEYLSKHDYHYLHFTHLTGTLTNWYLTKANKPDERVALPDDCRFKGNVVLHAMLEGKSLDTPAVSIQISLSKEHAWVVDRTPEKRGIWIEYGQGGAWYWLKEWDESQDDLQQPIRAKLGLFNNIFNILFDVHDGVEGHYALDHITLTPKQLHQRLSCNDDEAFENFKKSSERRFLVFQEPFDYSLLAEHGGAKFCRDHSRGLFDGYEKSKFFKDLSKGKSNKKWSIKEYRRSAELAEQRSQCEPWGEPRVRAKPIRPNWNMEAKLGQTTAPEAKKKGSKKRAGSTGDEEEPANKKRRVLEDSEDEEMEAPPPKKSRRFQPEDDAMEEVDLMKEESYSNQRMVAALVSLRYLRRICGCLPCPTFS